MFWTSQGLRDLHKHIQKACRHAKERAHLAATPSENTRTRFSAGANQRTLECHIMKYQANFFPVLCAFAMHVLALEDNPNSPFDIATTFSPPSDSSGTA